jgi:hypothetical protein
MKLFELLNDLARPPAAPFLLIGGHAVNLRGYSRNTHDVDFLVVRSDLPVWQRKLQGSGYSVEREERNFVHFSPDGVTAIWPVDLMLVNDQTFAKLQADAEPVNFAGVVVGTPSIAHLIALKLHVLRQNLEHRTIKDFTDVEELVRINQINLNSPEMKEIFERYGTPDLYRRVKVACGQ